MLKATNALNENKMIDAACYIATKRHTVCLQRQRRLLVPSPNRVFATRHTIWVILGRKHRKCILVVFPLFSWQRSRSLLFDARLTIWTWASFRIYGRKTLLNKQHSARTVHGKTTESFDATNKVAILNMQIDLKHILKKTRTPPFFKFILMEETLRYVAKMHNDEILVTAFTFCKI